MTFSVPFPLRLCGIFLAALCLSLFGCSANVPANSPLAGGQIRGNIHGGQQAISGASIQLYAAGATGYGSSATAQLATPVISDANGNFSITGSYVCPSTSSQLYIVATGGNPGLTAGTNNTSIALMAALGPCNTYGSQLTLDPSSFIWVNEVTTVASVYALSPFMGADAKHVGRSNTNQTGLANSFGLVNNLVNTTTGAALATTFAGNGTAPQATINTLANIIASCVNSDGTGTPCSALFTAATPSGGTAPTDTIQSILNIARNPANNVGTLYGLSSATPPFEPVLSAAPNDWTVQLQYRTVKFDTNGNGPTQTAIAIDNSGDAWIANEFTTSINLNSSVAELSNNGSILSGNSGYTGGGLNRPTGIAIDPSSPSENVWLINSVNPSLSKFNNGGGAVSGSTGYASTVSRGIAVDGTGNIWAGSLAKFDTNGNLLSGSGYTGGGLGAGDTVGGISIDPSENAWLAVSTGTSTSTVAKFSNAGAPLSGTGYIPSGLSAAWSTANDSGGNTWVTNNATTASVFKFANDGTVLSPTGGYTGSGLANPLAIAIDGAGDVWVTSDSVQNVGGTPTTVGTMVELDNNGNILSGGTGYNVLAAGYPVGDAIDASGNVWVAMANNYVIEMVGAAAPVVTPLSLGLKNGTFGTRP